MVKVDDVDGCLPRFLVNRAESASDRKSKRILKSEQVSANRWHLEIRLETPDQVDRELAGWLKNAHDLAG